VNVSQTLVQAAASFALVKLSLEGLAWVATDEKDKVYRAQLDGLFDALDRQSLYELARYIAGRTISRLRLASVNLLSRRSLLIVVVTLLLNYVALLLSFTEMALHNDEFVLDGFSLWRAAWVLFRELGRNRSSRCHYLTHFGLSWHSGCLVGSYLELSISIERALWLSFLHFRWDCLC
jgi:hypothetical protein